MFHSHLHRSQANSPADAVDVRIHREGGPAQREATREVDRHALRRTVSGARCEDGVAQVDGGAQASGGAEGWGDFRGDGHGRDFAIGGYGLSLRTWSAIHVFDAAAASRWMPDQVRHDNPRPCANMAMYGFRKSLF